MMTRTHCYELPLSNWHLWFLYKRQEEKNCHNLSLFFIMVFREVEVTVFTCETRFFEKKFMG